MLNMVDIPGAVPVERWDIENVAASSEIKQSNMLRHAAFVDDAASFDSLAFKMAHGEAVALDPQSRMLLEGVHNAMQAITFSNSDQAFYGCAESSRIFSFTFYFCCVLFLYPGAFATSCFCTYCTAFNKGVYLGKWGKGKKG